MVPREDRMKATYMVCLRCTSICIVCCRCHAWTVACFARMAASWGVGGLPGLEIARFESAMYICWQCMCGRWQAILNFIMIRPRALGKICFKRACRGAALDSAKRVLAAVWACFEPNTVVFSMDLMHKMVFWLQSGHVLCPAGLWSCVTCVAGFRKTCSGCNLGRFCAQCRWRIGGF